jgi:hypothetical protein
MLRRVAWQLFANVSEQFTATIIKAMLYLYQTTRRNIPEDSHLRGLNKERSPVNIIQNGVEKHCNQ